MKGEFMDKLQAQIKALEKEIEIKNKMILFTEKKNNIEINKKNPDSKFLKFYNNEIEKYQKEICEIYNELYKLWEEENKCNLNISDQVHEDKSSPLLQEHILNINNEENLLNANNHSNDSRCTIL
ncbi:hypothetical protein [Spiroplasma endosymbiont of Virgichneumon dumeticola]|uniref:hypothetical protein n=1 Tax=Spiroplasma endosymbiont of Virgichneumon dumeticola TaxID=3139323 RepID=UPI0035C9140A